MNKGNRRIIDSFVLKEVTIEYNTDPKDGESINTSITGILDKVEAEYEVEKGTSIISFSLSNIKSVKIKLTCNDMNEIIIGIEDNNKW